MSETSKLETLHEMKEELTSMPDLSNMTPQTKVMIHSELPYAPSMRFLPGKAKEIMTRLLREKIGDVVYDMEQAPLWAREISDAVKNEIREMGLERYKIVVQTVIGEQREQGFQFASKCLWDPNTDDYTFASFVNDRVFGVVGAWAMYLT